MGKFTVYGGTPLVGEITVSGSKNAALPVIFASLITYGTTKIDNLPDITDVRFALDIVSELGVSVLREGNTVYLDTRELRYSAPDEGKVAMLRASTYLIGACLSRFGRAELQSFGGCNFSSRPIDLHISAAESFGGICDGRRIVAESLRATEISFPKKSVGATVNAIIMASGIEKTSVLHNCATEPHVFNLVDYLVSAGAKIVREKDTFFVTGGRLSGGNVRIRGDMIEAGTYLAASLLTGGRVFVKGLDYDELGAFLSAIKAGGVTSSVSERGLSLSGGITKRISVETAAYPGFPTDLQPIIAPVLAAFSGGSITEGVWQGRFGYLSELAKGGVRYVINERGAEIYHSELVPAVFRSPDLRGGAAAVITALAIRGKSTVESGERILRGYDSFADKLTALGAKIAYEK